MRFEMPFRTEVPSSDWHVRLRETRTSTHVHRFARRKQLEISVSPPFYSRQRIPAQVLRISSPNLDKRCSGLSSPVRSSSVGTKPTAMALKASNILALLPRQRLPSRLSSFTFFRRFTMSVIKRSLPECWGHRGVSLGDAATDNSPLTRPRPRLPSQRTRSLVSRPPCATAPKASRAVFEQPEIRVVATRNLLEQTSMFP